jgi:SNF2 family DNA or RNA helicase
MLPILAGALAVNGLGTVSYNGAMTAVRKAEAIARFTTGPDVRVFLSSHAGAYGCDMYMASHLVNYDIPVSGGKAAQIDGRHVRASNDNETVYIRHLLAQHSLDERKLAQVRFKKRIASAIVDGHGADHLGRIENNIGSLTQFLEALLET